MTRERLARALGWRVPLTRAELFWCAALFLVWAHAEHSAEVFGRSMRELYV